MLGFWDIWMWQFKRICLSYVAGISITVKRLSCNEVKNFYVYLPRAGKSPWKLKPLDTSDVDTAI